MALVGTLGMELVCMQEHKQVVGMRVHKLVLGMLVGMQEHKLVVGMLVGMQEHKLVVGMQEHKRVLARGMLEGIQVGKRACMLEGIQVRKLGVVGKQVCIPVGKQAVRKQVGKADRSIQMSHSSYDCWNIPPIGVLSCTIKATRH